MRTQHAITQTVEWCNTISKNKKESWGFMFAISVILLVGGTIFLISSAFISEFNNSAFIIGLILAFTGLGVFLYEIFLE